MNERPGHTIIVNHSQKPNQMTDDKANNRKYVCKILFLMEKIATGIRENLPWPRGIPEMLTERILISWTVMDN
jgi:hypothetical protein